MKLAQHKRVQGRQLLKGKEREGKGAMSLKQKKRAGSELPRDLSVRKKALFRRRDFIICKSQRGIVFLLNPLLLSSGCGTSVMKCIYHLQSDKLSVAAEDNC